MALNQPLTSLQHLQLKRSIEGLVQRMRKNTASPALHPMRVLSFARQQCQQASTSWMPKMQPVRAGANDHYSIPSIEDGKAKEFTGSFISMASHLIRSTSTGSRTATKGGWKAGN